MAKIKLPPVGSWGNGQQVQIAGPYTLGSSTDNDVVLSSTGVYSIADVEAGVMIHDIKARTNTAFTSTATLTIGDSDAADGFFADTDLIVASSDAVGVFKTSMAASQTYSPGKLYVTAQDLEATVGTATVDAGQIELYIMYSRPATQW